MTKMTAFLGYSRNTEVNCEVIDIGCGVGETICFECGGDGDWTKFMPEHGPQSCIPCKGTGRVLISI
jgi:hypothetical protein